MKKVYIVDSCRQILTQNLSNNYSVDNNKSYRYFLLIVEQGKCLDDKYFLLGFGIGTTVNRKYITKRSIIVLIYFLTKLLLMKEKIFHNIYYTVDIGNLNDQNIINSIKRKHEIKNINKECIIDLEDEIVDDFVYYYFNWKNK